jgi:hypothetical protein
MQALFYSGHITRTISLSLVRKEKGNKLFSVRTIISSKTEEEENQNSELSGDEQPSAKSKQCSSSVPNPTHNFLERNSTEPRTEIGIAGNKT